jgi:hypothetical protein
MEYDSNGPRSGEAGVWREVDGLARPAGGRNTGDHVSAYERAAIERAHHGRVDRTMREGGLLPLDPDGPAAAGLRPEDRGTLLYARDGLVASRAGTGWRVFVQATGERLVDLPDEPGVVVRFVEAAEAVASWVTGAQADPARRERLERHAREAVETELWGCHARQARLGRWFRERGVDPDGLTPPWACGRERRTRPATRGGDAGGTG